MLAGVTTAGVTTYELTLANSAVQYRSGAKTATCGYNGHDFWGPTLLIPVAGQSKKCNIVHLTSRKHAS